MARTIALFDPRTMDNIRNTPWLELLNGP